MKNVFDYLPRAYEYGATDPGGAPEDGGCILHGGHGVCQRIPRRLPLRWRTSSARITICRNGVANALMICHVLRYNAAEVPAKMGTFPQYDHPHTLARYAECARFCGVCGKGRRGRRSTCSLTGSRS